MVFGQAYFPTVDSGRKFTNRYIRNSAIEAFTNLRLNTVLNGMWQHIDSARLLGGGGGGGDNNFPSSLGFSAGTLTLGRTGLSNLTTSITTSNIPESGGVLWFTTTRARQSIVQGYGWLYDNTSGVGRVDTSLFGNLSLIKRTGFDTIARVTGNNMALKAVNFSIGNGNGTINKFITDTSIHIEINPLGVGGGEDLYLSKNTSVGVDSTNNAINFGNLNGAAINLSTASYDRNILGRFRVGVSDNPVPDPPGSPNNPVMVLGYNTNLAGTREISTDAAIWISMEGHYMGTFGTAGAMELHIPQVMSLDGTLNKRLQSWTINRENLSSLLYFTTSSVEFRKYDNDSAYFSLAPTGVGIIGDNSSQISFRFPRTGAVGTKNFDITFDGADVRLGFNKTIDNLFIQPRLYTYLGNTIGFLNSDYGNNVSFELPASGTVYDFYSNGATSRPLRITASTSELVRGLLISGRAFYDVRPALGEPDSLGIYSKAQVDSAILAGGGGGISGLTTTYIPKALSATSIGNSLLIDNGTKITVTDPASSGVARLDIGVSGVFLQTDNGSGEFRLSIPGGGYFPTFYSNSAEAFRVTTGGNLLLGSTTDNGHKFQVNGNIGIATNGYLNFSTTNGSGGYGFRDNSGSLELKNSGGAWTPFGYVQYDIATDANYTVLASGHDIELPTISANRTITLPTATAGRELVFFNRNSAGFAWQFSPAVKGPDDADLTNLVNDLVYILKANGTNWRIQSAN